MNFIYTLITVIALMSPLQQGVPYAKLDTAFDKKNAEAIVAHAKDKVLINVLGKEGAYSKSQAVLVLKDFFSGKQNGTFNFTFKGNESPAGTFAIGNYGCSGTKYRITMHFKAIGDEYKIESITIEKD